MEKDIKKFKEFCNQNSLDYQDIIYDTYFQPNSENFKKSILSYSDENLLFLLTDLSQNKKFKEHFTFFHYIGYNEELKRDINVLFFSSLLLVSNYEKSFNFVINTYEKEISYLMNKFGDEKYDCKNFYDWESFFISKKMNFYKNALQNGGNFPLRYDELNFVINNFSKEKLSYFLINNSISKKPGNDSKKLKI